MNYKILFFRFFLLPFSLAASLLVALLSNDYFLYYAARWFLILFAPLLLSVQSIGLIISSAVFFIPGLVYNYAFYGGLDPGLVAGPFLYMYSSITIFHYLAAHANVVCKFSLRSHLELLVYLLLISNIVLFALHSLGIILINYDSRGIIPDRFSINNPLEFYFIILGLILSVERLSGGIWRGVNYFSLFSVAISKSRIFIVLLAIKIFFDSRNAASKAFLLIIISFGFVYVSIGDERFHLHSLAQDPSLVIRIIKIDEFLNYDFNLIDRFFGLGSNSYKIITGSDVSLEFLLIDILFSFGAWPFICFFIMIFNFRKKIKIRKLSVIEILFLIYGLTMIPISYATPVLFFVLAIIIFDIKDESCGYTCGRNKRRKYLSYPKGAGQGDSS